MSRRSIHVVSAVAFTLFLTATVTPSHAQGTSPRCAAPPARGGDLLSLDLESLMDMKIITASKFEENAGDAPGVVSVISRDDLRRFGGMTLGEVLDRVPGLSLSTNAITDRSLVTARGTQTKPHGGHVLFLIDGRPMREVLEGGLVTDLVASFPLSVLERIEVVKGPGSVLYGSNAFAAVVNLITIESVRSGMRAVALGGSSGALGASGHAAFACGRFSLVGAGHVRHLDDWTTTYQSVNPFLAGVSSVTGPGPDEGSGVFLKATYGGLHADILVTRSELPVFVGPTIGETRTRRGFADVGYVRSLNRVWDLSVNGSYNRHLLAIETPLFIDRDSHELTLEWTNTVRVSSRTALTAGGLYSHIDGRELYTVAPPAVMISEGQRHNGAVYSQVDHRLHPSLKVIGGFQANKIGALPLDVVPRMGVIWNPATHVSVKTLWGQAFRAPSINETSIDHPGLVGDPSLKPEKVSSFDLALAYRADRFEGGINYFRAHQTNSITLTVDGERFRYANLGVATFSGFELDGKYYLDKRFYLVGSTLYQQNHDGVGVENVAAVPTFGAKFGVSYQSDAGITASLFDSYQSATRTPAPELNLPAGAHHLVRAHVRLDLSRYLAAGAADALALVVHVNNVRNAEIWSRDLWNPSNTVPVDRGRIFYVGAEVALGGARVRR
jgi:outer membrane receptor for ferrienterochelin and colicin